MFRLLSWLGLGARLRRLRIAWGEGALAAGDRARLIQIAWDRERRHLGRLVGLLAAVTGLGLMAVAMLSVAVVVHFWDTPQRIGAAWSVAGFWTFLWAVAIYALRNQVVQSRKALDPTLQTFAQDWEAVRHRLSQTSAHGHASSTSPPPAQALTEAQLLERIHAQRLRVQTLQAPDPRPQPEALPLNVEALRLVRKYPVATGAVAAVTLVVVGPRRLLRWAMVAAPTLWRLRR